MYLSIRPSSRQDGRYCLQQDLDVQKDTLAIDILLVKLDLLFEAVIEATEEAIINSLFAAKSVSGRGNVRVDALPADKVLEIMKKYNGLKR